jgi:hypothetical protein
VSRLDGIDALGIAARMAGSLASLAAMACTGATGSSTSGLTGTPCANAVGLSQSATAEGDTCEAGAEIPLTPCAAEAPAAVFSLTPPRESAHVVFRVTEGFATFVADPLIAGGCSFFTRTCDAGGVHAAGELPDVSLYLAVARADGACGPFRLDLVHASSCADVNDAGSCLCGDIPACPPGQTCHIGPAPQFAGSCVP